MAMYALDIPALPPLESGSDDGPAPGIVQGQALSDDHVLEASRQLKNRKRLAQMDPPHATENEVLDSKKRKHRVASANFDGPTPLWAQQMQQNMQQQMQDLQQNMQQQMQNFQKSLQQQMQEYHHLLAQESERSMNRSRRRNSDRIQPVVRARDGVYPAQDNLWFPQDEVTLSSVTGQRLNALLNFYKLDASGTLAEKRLRIRGHLGVNL